MALSTTITVDDSITMVVDVHSGIQGEQGETGPAGSSGAPEVKSASFTAEVGKSYIGVATLTVTDPTPSEGANFEHLVRSGTSTVGGVAYAVAGTIIRRVYHSGAWANYEYSDSDAYATAAQGSLADSSVQPTQTDASETLDVSVATGVVLTSTPQSIVSGLTNQGVSVYEYPIVTGVARTLITPASVYCGTQVVGEPASSIASTAISVQEGSNGVTLYGNGTMSVTGLATFSGGITVATSGTFNATTYTFGTGAAAAFRTALGSGTTGDALFTAATAISARSTLGTRRYVKASNETRTNTATPTADSELTGISVVSGTWYEVTCLLNVAYTAGSTGGVHFQLSGTGFTAPSLIGYGFQTVWNTATLSGIGGSGSNLVIVAQATSPTNTASQVVAKIYFKATANGNVGILWSQNSAVGGATLTLYAGSMISVTEL